MIKSLPCYLLIVLLCVGILPAQFDYGFDFTKAGSAGLQFLKIGIGARECAMGEAAIATVSDANAVFWNAAGLSAVEQMQVHFSYNQWLVNSRYDAAVVAYPWRSYVFALSIASLSIEEFEETTVLQPQGTGRMVNAGDILLGLAITKRFTNKLSIGAQIKFVQEKLDNYTMENILFDIGALYYTGFHKLRLAFALQHFGPDMRPYNLNFRTPLLFRVAIADDIVQHENLRIITAAELVHPTDNVEWLNFGIEGLFRDVIALRAGYRYNRDEDGITLGAGIRLPRNDWLDFTLDYAWMPYGAIFSDVHRISIGFGF